jgi:hypothetical protein
MCRNRYKVWALLFCLPNGFARRYPILFGRLIFRQYNAVPLFHITANGNGFVSQFRVVKTFN